MRQPRILAVASAVDLDFRYGCTPAWWQLWKGLYEAGVDLVVTPYRGRPVESPWWRTAPNPTYREGESYALLRSGLARLKGDRYLRRDEDNPDESALDKADARDDLEGRHAPVAPAPRPPDRPRAPRRGARVHRADGALPRHPDVPARAPRHPGRLLRRRRPDEPAGVRRHGHGLQLLPRRRSVRVRPRPLELGGWPRRLLELGARRAEAVLWAADPEFFRPLPVEKEHDVFFYGYGDKFRREWMAALVGEPCRRDPRIDFALGGRDFQGDVGGARLLGDVPFNVFARAISAARINLNITRRAHATVDGSSTCRPFELAASGAAIVSNPHGGLERWFEPGEELVVVEDADVALDAYHGLLDDPAGPRRWALGRGSASSTSTPTRIGPARCSASSSSSGGDGVTQDRRGRPRLRRGGRHRARRRGDPRVRPRRSTSSSSTTGPPTRTAASAAAAGAAVVRLPFNLGIGAAVQTGFRYALEHSYDLAVRLDGDGQHDPAQLSKLLEPVARDEADVVTGSRFRDVDGGYRPPLARRLGISWFARLVSLLSGQRVTDTTSGFQALNRKGIALFARDYPSDYPEVEATVLVLKHRLRLVEVPVRCASASTARRRSRSCARSTTRQGHARPPRRDGPPLRGAARRRSPR